MKTLLREIKNFNAIDITDCDIETLTCKSIVAFSMGRYGINGLLFIGNDEKYYKITRRVSLLYKYL